MGCGCGSSKKSVQEFKIKPYVDNGWYFIDLCDGYKLKYKTKIYYIVNGDDIWVKPKDEIIKWVKDFCDVEL